MDSWSDDRVALLKKLQADSNLSFNLMGGELNRLPGPMLSRNAVIGKAKRLGLPERGKQFGAHLPRKGRSRAISQTTVIHLKKPLPEEPITVAESADASPKHIALIELTASTCRWPYGNKAPFTFCGCTPKEGSPYCAPHAKQACGQAVFGSPEHYAKISEAHKARHAAKRAAA